MNLLHPLSAQSRNLIRSGLICWTLLSSLACATQRSSVGELTATQHKRAPRARTGEATCERPPSLWGVIIGVGQHQDPRISPLKSATSDAWILYHYLTHPAGGAVPRDQLRLLLNQEATRETVEATLSQQLAHACPQDSALLYFAGHGTPEPHRPSDVFLLTADSDLDLLPSTALSLKMLPTYLRWRAGHVESLTLIIDACHAGELQFSSTRGVLARPAELKPYSGEPRPAQRAGGRALRSTSLAQATSSLSAQQRGWSVLSATTSAQVAFEGITTCPAWGAQAGGVFTCALISALQRRSLQASGELLSLTQLHKAVHAQVSEVTGGLQTPTLSVQSGQGAPNLIPIRPAQGAVPIPPLPDQYRGAHSSTYTPYRWGSLGALGLSGLLSVALTLEARDRVQAVNQFDHRSGRSDAYWSLRQAHTDATEALTFSLVGVGVTSLLSAGLGLLEWADEPEGREEAYQKPAWLQIQAGEVRAPPRPLTPAPEPAISSGAREVSP